jgi:sigma-B regulation protein RsbU (phosphoserine phosphatase)
MGLLHGAVRSSHWFGDGTVHEEASERLNQLLCLRTSVEMFASLFWCYYDPDTQRLRYVNAGHLPPFVASPNGDGTPKLSRLEEGGPVLGVIPVARYRQGEVEFHPGDLMVLYSDGVVEAANAAEEEFGEERLASIIRENWSRPSIEIRDEIMRQVQAFVGREQVQDDLTLLVVRAGAPAAGQSEVEAGSQA